MWSSFRIIAGIMRFIWETRLFTQEQILSITATTYRYIPEVTNGAGSTCRVSGSRATGLQKLTIRKMEPLYMQDRIGTGRASPIIFMQIITEPILFKQPIWWIRNGRAIMGMCILFLFRRTKLLSRKKMFTCWENLPDTKSMKQPG